MLLRTLATALLMGSLTAACSSQATSAPTTASTSGIRAAERAEITKIVTIPGAVSVNVAGNGTDEPVVAWIGAGEVRVANVETATWAIVGELVVSEGVEPIAHPIERPGLAVGGDGTIHVAFTSHLGAGGSVFYARVTGDDTDGPHAISGDPRPETNLVHATTDEDGGTALAWLEDSTLSVATSHRDEPEEVELVDDLTCDCCNPAPVFASDALIVPYRDYDMIDGQVVRNVASVRSLDGGTSFEDPVDIADDDWFIDACPFTGPSAVMAADTLVVAFMDGRQSVHPDQTSSSIWVDVSQDGGATFGPDLEVTGDGINRWPVLAVDDAQVIHLVWEVQGPDGGLAYSYSTDLGSTFTDPVTLLGTSDGAGSPKSPSVAHHDGELLITWTDREGGHLGRLPVR